MWLVWYAGVSLMWQAGVSLCVALAGASLVHSERTYIAATAPNPTDRYESGLKFGSFFYFYPDGRPGRELLGGGQL